MQPDQRLHSKLPNARIICTCTHMHTRVHPMRRIWIKKTRKHGKISKVISRSLLEFEQKKTENGKTVEVQRERAYGDAGHCVYVVDKNSPAPAMGRPQAGQGCRCRGLAVGWPWVVGCVGCGLWDQTFSGHNRTTTPLATVELL